MHPPRPQALGPGLVLGSGGCRAARQCSSLLMTWRAVPWLIACLQGLSAVLQSVLPEGSRDAVRTLMAHVARTARVSARDPGVPVSEVESALGVQVGGCCLRV